MESKGASRVPLLTSLKRAQVASLAASIVDFGTLIALVELLKVWYVAATAIGALLGAVTNFSLGRHWSFEAREGSARSQALRYGLIAGLSVCLNSAGVYALTDGARLPYPLSKAIVSLLVGIFFNFPLHRHFVFR